MRRYANQFVDFMKLVPILNLLVVVMLSAALLRSLSAIDENSDECGLASVYSTTSEETASGEDTQRENSTAAHRSLPFGTMVRVNNQENGRSTVVRITDRGPFTGGRIVDVSQVAARELGISGLAQVCLEIVLIPDTQAERAILQKRAPVADDRLGGFGRTGKMAAFVVRWPICR